jgi:hypothetical protein
MRGDRPADAKLLPYAEGVESGTDSGDAVRMSVLASDVPALG